MLLKLFVNSEDIQGRDFSLYIIKTHRPFQQKIAKCKSLQQPML